MPTLILASNSPRRKDALKRLQIPFIVVQNTINEKKESARSHGDPESVARYLSYCKAEAVANRYPDHFILGMDTIVVINQQVIGKPYSEDDALNILRELSGNWHTVITAITLCNKKKDYTKSRAVHTKVKFNRLSEDQIKEYVATGESLDKAGAYGIQSAGSFLVEKIDGDFSNVVGFPEQTVISMLTEAGFPLQSV